MSGPTADEVRAAIREEMLREHKDRLTLIREALIRVLETEVCESFLCSERIPIGDGLCATHDAEVSAATDRLVDEINLYRADFDPEQEQQEQRR